MPVPYGFGVGDFIAVGTLAWSVYKSCWSQPYAGHQQATNQWVGKAAPGSFENISAEVLSLHAVLKEGEETLFVSPLSPERAERLKVIKDGCDKVLVDLQRLVERYESLGTQSKRTWDRMKWGKEDIAEIRTRLISNITILTAYISTSQISVENKLDKFIEEFRQGKRETSIVSLQTVDSLSVDDRAAWRTIRKELEEIGISVAAFEANRNFIFDWFVRTVETGAFEEENGHSVGEAVNDSDEQESRSNEQHQGHGTGRQINIESYESVHEDQPRLLQLLSQSAHEKKPQRPEPGTKTLDQIVASTRIAPKNKAHVPRVAAVLAVLSRPRQRLINAIDTGDFNKALKILKDEASFQLLDLGTLNKALWSATRRVIGSDPCPLLAELIARGSNVNYISSDFHERTPLWNSAANGSLSIARLLVANGADVSYTGSERTRLFRLQDGAYDFAPRAALVAPRAASQQSLDILRLLLSSGVNANTRYKIKGSTSTDGIYSEYFHEFTLVQEAASLGAVAAIEILLEHGAEIDAVSPDHGTALVLALSGGQVDAARFLLFKGADPNFNVESQNAYQSLSKVSFRKPIEAAVIGGKTTLLKDLLNRGAVPDDEDLRLAGIETQRRIREGSSTFTNMQYANDIRRILKDAMEHGRK